MYAFLTDYPVEKTVHVLQYYRLYRCFENTWTKLLVELILQKKVNDVCKINILVICWDEANPFNF